MRCCEDAAMMSSFSPHPPFPFPSLRSKRSMQKITLNKKICFVRNDAQYNNQLATSMWMVFYQPDLHKWGLDSLKMPPEMKNSQAVKTGHEDLFVCEHKMKA